MALRSYRSETLRMSLTMSDAEHRAIKEKADALGLSLCGLLKMSAMALKVEFEPAVEVRTGEPANHRFPSTTNTPPITKREVKK